MPPVEKILTLQTTSWGMEPVVEASGRAALEHIQQGEPFDLAILDMQMPEIDGLTLAEMIHRNRNAAALPMVMLSSIGQSANDERNRLFAACLSKPIKASQLYNTLVDILVGEDIASTTGR